MKKVYVLFCVFHFYIDFSKGQNKFNLNMHPPLDLHLHPMCKEVITKFQACHNDHPWAKFLGKCNDMKRELDKCLYEEVLIDLFVLCLIFEDEFFFFCF